MCIAVHSMEPLDLLQREDKMQSALDVIVIGGGPIGCYTAHLLAREGLEVLVLEEHPSIGEPPHCTGVIGAEAFEKFELPQEAILDRLSSATFFSPGGLKAEFSTPRPVAFVVDRVRFDQGIASQARASGADFLLNCRAMDVQESSGALRVIARCNGETRELKARLVVLADGPGYALQRRLGMGSPREYLQSAQVEVEVEGVNGVEVYFGQGLAPGSFAWIVPFRRGDGLWARIGLSTKREVTNYLKRVLDHPPIKGRVKGLISPPRVRSIPIKPLPRTYGYRVLVVGDAAGLCKPTTGGGIYYGLICSEIAARVAANALKMGEFGEKALAQYEREWKGKLGLELRMGFYFRWLGSRLGDEEIDEVFRIGLQDGLIPVVKAEARFDWHRDVITALLRYPGLARIFFRGILRRK